MLDKLKVDVDLRDTISFFKQSEHMCPSCGEPIVQEELKTGGGRLDAGSLTEDLHRLYLSTEEYGAVFPLLYLVYTCNKCYFSALSFDFTTKFKRKTMDKICEKSAKEKRLKMLKELYSEVPDFTKQKTLVTGLAAYLLAMASYDDFAPEDSPHIRMGVCAIRCAWLCGHIEDAVDDEDEKKFVGTLKKVLYKKAFYLYNRALDLSYSPDGDREDISRIKYVGPDFDKEYGYDGIIYICAWLFIKHGYSPDIAYREATLGKLKTNLSKVFGFGRSSKAKPSALLEVARGTYETIEEEIKALG